VHQPAPPPQAGGSERHELPQVGPGPVAKRFSCILGGGGQMASPGTCWAKFGGHGPLPLNPPVVLRRRCCCMMGARRPPLPIDISYQHGAQQQTRRSCSQMMGQTGRRTNRWTDARPFHRPCSLYYACSFNSTIVRFRTRTWSPRRSNLRRGQSLGEGRWRGGYKRRHEKKITS